ncbi:hypothetical protein NI17_009730 [Thermobifida halotolerans]|uniref:Uncharacterized protein n=1 Tax=Thermobifida halotolerans TaxID=483545 RepID=A0A399FZX9_9ACTN|nr:hypothetical protein [Thermobifida halotolerans]UOE21369.1 hypothetical protein NI17_009730 [Thermobifida halotolerans]
MADFRYYYAENETGDRIDDPSEDALFMMIKELDGDENTFVVVQPEEEKPEWYVSIATSDESGYEIVRYDSKTSEHVVTVDNSVDRISVDITVWTAARSVKNGPFSP